MHRKRSFSETGFPKTRVIVEGLGAMGSGIARLLLDKRDLVSLVGAGAARPDKQGKDLGELLGTGEATGVIVTSVQELPRIEADVVIQATTSFAV